MTPANATSSGKPIINKATGQVDFHYLMHTEAGQRWVSIIGPNGVPLDPPEYKPVFADSYAQVSSAVELELANRSDDAHHLVMLQHCYKAAIDGRRLVRKGYGRTGIVVEFGEADVGAWKEAAFGKQMLVGKR